MAGEGGGGALVSGALGAGLLAAALMFPAGEAQARDECGALSSGAATCSNQAYASGIRYDVTDGWGDGIAGDITLTVTGGAATAITSATATGWGSGIVLRTAHHASETRTIALTVGSGSNNVDITQSAATITGGFDDTGVVLHQRAIGASPTTATLGGGVDIGTSSAPMQRSGIHVLVENGGNTGTHTITSAATIHSAEFGIIMDNRGASDTVITNSGSITTTTAGGSASNKSGIRILDWSHNPAGGSYGGDSRTADTTATVTNSGSITVSGADARGIEVDAMGLGLYKVVNSGSGTKGITASGAGGHGVMVVATWHTGAAGSTAVEIENSGRITTSGVNGLGIYVETVGATGLTATQHKGDVEISNSGSISSANTAVIVNANMGAVSVTHSGGSIASSAFDGIRIQQGGTGAATVASGADVTGERRPRAERGRQRGQGGGHGDGRLGEVGRAEQGGRLDSPARDGRRRRRRLGGRDAHLEAQRRHLRGPLEREQRGGADQDHPGRDDFGPQGRLRPRGARQRGGRDARGGEAARHRHRLDGRVRARPRAWRTRSPSPRKWRPRRPCATARAFYATVRRRG